MCLSHDFKMISNASYLNYFRLMPLEPFLRPLIAANWSVTELDREQRLFRFTDCSTGNITKYHWEFGDGATSGEKNPIHQYQKAGEWVVKLYIEGPDGKDKRIKIWEVVTK